MEDQLFQKNDIIHDHYTVLSLIGRGGIGTTYRVLDSMNERIVVLKTLDLENVKDWKEIELFEREISALKNMHHKFIPDYYDNFKLKWHDKTLYVLVMEYIDGRNLYECIKDGVRFSVDEVKTVLEKLLSILTYIHNVQPPVIHRDINPRNIIRSEDNDIFLVDFGAIGSLVADTIVASTSSTMVGTIGYMPPEQLYGKSLPASDIYSLGVTILFLLTGKDPSTFNLKNMRIDYRSFVNINGDFKHLLDKMIDPDLEKRIKDADQVLQLLKKENLKEKRIKTKVENECKELPSLSDVDRIVAVQKKQEAERKKAVQLEEEKTKKIKKDNEQREIEKAHESPRRVYVNKTDEGFLLTLRRSQLAPYLKNRFTGDIAVSIAVSIGSLPFIIPFFIALEEFRFIIFFLSNPTIYYIFCFTMYPLLIFLGKILLSMLSHKKDFHLLVTKKNNVLIYLKNPLKPRAMGDKKQLTFRIDETGNSPGSAGKGTKAWKNIAFYIGNYSFEDNGFKPEDSDRIREFCKEHNIKEE